MEQLVDLFVREWVAGHWRTCIDFGLLGVIWRLWTMLCYANELARREQERALKRANETQTRLLRAFLSEPSPTLASLANDTERAFKVTP